MTLQRAFLIGSFLGGLALAAALSPPAAPAAHSCCKRHALAVGKNGEQICPHQAQVDEWHKWRKNNPHAHSRYKHGDREDLGFSARANVGAFEPITPDDPEPEPDPGFGGCGCPLDIALKADSCGWWVSQVYS